MEQLLERISQTVAESIDVGELVRAAAQTVPPLWPLDSAIAVNPLAGFEHQEFTQAVSEAARLFDASPTLAPTAWRKLVERGDIEDRAVRQAVIKQLGGLDAAFQQVGAGRQHFDGNAGLAGFGAAFQYGLA